MDRVYVTYVAKHVHVVTLIRSFHNNTTLDNMGGLACLQKLWVNCVAQCWKWSQLRLNCEVWWCVCVCQEVTLQSHLQHNREQTATYRRGLWRWVQEHGGPKHHQRNTLIQLSLIFSHCDVRTSLLRHQVRRHSTECKTTRVHVDWRAVSAKDVNCIKMHWGHLNAYDNKYRYLISNLWNNLPITVGECPTHSSFKTQLTGWLESNQTCTHF